MTQVRVPTLGESVTEATVATWFKKVGDLVAVDEMLCELETDKVTVEVPSPISGILKEIISLEGSAVGIDALLAEIKESDLEVTATKEFDVKKNASAGLSLTSLAIAFTGIDFYLLSNNRNWCITPVTIACGNLAVFSGVALYIALPGEPTVQVLVASQAMAVGVQLGAIANVGRFVKKEEAKATELSDNFELSLNNP